MIVEKFFFLNFKVIFVILGRRILIVDVLLIKNIVEFVFFIYCIVGFGLLDFRNILKFIIVLLD